MREAVGDEIDLMTDLHGPPWMTTSDAIVLGRALEPYHLLFMEDPIAPEHIEQYQRIRDAVAIPLAAGERMATIWGERPLIERELVDVIQPDTGRAGGISQMKKMAAMAEAHGIMMAPHSGSLGPVAEYAAIHLLAAIPNALMLERIEDDWPGREEVITPAPKQDRGYLARAQYARPRRRHQRGSGRPLSEPAQCRHGRRRLRARHRERARLRADPPAPRGGVQAVGVQAAAPLMRC